MSSQDPIKAEEFSCSLCEHCALTEAELEEHIDQIHFEFFSVKCEQDLKTEVTALVFHDGTKTSGRGKKSKKRKKINNSGIDNEISRGDVHNCLNKSVVC